MSDRDRNQVPDLPHHVTFRNGWSFELRAHEGTPYLNIPVTGWGGYGGAAVRDQDEWVQTHLEPMPGVHPQWMGQWRVDEDALDEVIERLEREA